MKKRLLILVVMSIVTVVSTIASAGCMYSGYEYPTGTTIGGFTCQADGSWK